jgi:hypothetical protein
MPLTLQLLLTLQLPLILQLLLMALVRSFRLTLDPEADLNPPPNAIARRIRKRAIARKKWFALPYFPLNNPNTPTPFVVPTYTFPFAIIGIINLFPAPK